MLAYYNISAFTALYIVEIVHDVEDYVVFIFGNDHIRFPSPRMCPVGQTICLVIGFL